MLKNLMSRFTPYAPLLLRLIIGFTFVMHGIPKVQSPSFFASYVATLGFPVPTFLAIVVTFLEALGGLLLMVGFGTRWIALFEIIEMTITTLVVKLPAYGFIAPGSAPGTGAELDLLLLVGALVILILGPGEFSLDKNMLKSE
jgi:putative oxidoreductase